MHIREPRDFEAFKAKRRARGRFKKIRRGLVVGTILVICLCLLAFGAYARPLPTVAARTIIPSVPVSQVALTWPAVGQAAMGVDGQGVMAATANQTPVPTASVAKVMTALTVLKKHPLSPGQTGPMITMTADDVARYNSYLAQDGSVVRVEVGEQMSEYQALQAILLPSANNIADTLAVWAYGSMSAYHLAANQMAASLGMTQSKFAADASGLSPSSVSTAHDLVLLGQAALDNPVVKQIVAQPTAELPLVGTVRNVNVLLGYQGIIGIKTGNSDQAGGCYLFAATQKLSNGQMATAIGAIMGAPTLGQAMTSSLPLLTSFYQGFAANMAVPRNTVVARYTIPWDKAHPVDAVTSQDTSVMNWQGSKLTIKVQPTVLAAPQKAGASAGTLTAQSAYATTTTPVVLAAPIPQPSWYWRIVRR